MEGRLQEFVLYMFVHTYPRDSYLDLTLYLVKNIIHSTIVNPFTARQVVRMIKYFVVFRFKHPHFLDLWLDLRSSVKQLGSERDAEKFGVSSVSEQFESGIIFF